MSTVKPRVYVTLQLETYQAITKIAVLQKRSASSVISELADMAAPSYTRVVGFMERLNAVEQVERVAIEHGLAAAEDLMEAMFQYAYDSVGDPIIDSVDPLTERLEIGREMAESARENGGADDFSRADDHCPRSSNTGATRGC